MKQFLTAEGIEDITMSNEELFCVIAKVETITPQLAVYLKFFNNIVEGRGIIFKHPLFDYQEAHDLIGNHAKLDTNIAMMEIRGAGIYDARGCYSIITQIAPSKYNPPLCYIMEPSNRQSLDILYRKKIIDDMLKTI